MSRMQIILMVFKKNIKFYHFLASHWRQQFDTNQQGYDMNYGVKEIGSTVFVRL